MLTPLLLVLLHRFFELALAVIGALSLCAVSKGVLKPLLTEGVVLGPGVLFWDLEYSSPRRDGVIV